MNRAKIPPLIPRDRPRFFSTWNVVFFISIIDPVRPFVSGARVSILITYYTSIPGKALRIASTMTFFSILLALAADANIPGLAL